MMRVKLIGQTDKTKEFDIQNGDQSVIVRVRFVNRKPHPEYQADYIIHCDVKYNRWGGDFIKFLSSKLGYSFSERKTDLLSKWFNSY